MSQNQSIINYLIDGKGITALKALKALSLFGCFRLASRINDLRKKGYPIDSTMIKTTGGKRVAEYKISEVYFIIETV